MDPERKYKSKLLYYIRIHLFGIETAFLEFNNYNNLIEDKFIEEKENRRKSFTEFCKNERPKDFETGYDDFLLKSLADNYWEIDSYFPHNFRASFLIQIISFIEFELKEICNHHHLQNSTHFNINDLKGSSDMEKAKLYLSKECKIDFSGLEPEWELINLMRKIRNKLVHYQGIISKGDKDWKIIYDFVSKNNFIELKEEVVKDVLHDQFTILIRGKEFNELLLENATGLFKKLLEDNLFLLNV